MGEQHVQQLLFNICDKCDVRGRVRGCGFLRDGPGDGGSEFISRRGVAEHDEPNPAADGASEPNANPDSVEHPNDDESVEISHSDAVRTSVGNPNNIKSVRIAIDIVTESTSVWVPVSVPDEDAVAGAEPVAE